MTAYHMRPTREIEIFLQFLPVDLRDIVLELRSLVVSAVPSVTEVIHPKRLIYYDAMRGGPVSAGVCQIRTHSHHIELVFVHGAFLPDPGRLLVGDQKAMRHVDICSFDSAPWPALEAFVEASARFDPHSPGA